MTGPIAQHLADDHRRLESLLARMFPDGSTVDRAAYDPFRSGLLRHIGIEEKLLFPLARRAGAAVEVLARLRADHARLTALLVPTPTRELMDEVGAILAPHDALEEGETGIYATCEALAGADAGELLERIEEAPEVPTRPNQDRIRPKKLS